LAPEAAWGSPAVWSHLSWPPHHIFFLPIGYLFPFVVVPSNDPGTS
jgi:hypothetical protein